MGKYNKKLEKLQKITEKHKQIVLEIRKKYPKLGKEKINVMPFEIKGIQTDNGSEFLGEFTKALKKKEIKHYFNYPRYPKGQAYVERMNRTLQEEFVIYCEDYELEDIYEFNKKMLQYMLWYNTERPHHSLNKKSPIQYFCDIINSNKSESSKSGRTYTTP